MVENVVFRLVRVHGSLQCDISRQFMQSVVTINEKERCQSSTQRTRRSSHARRQSDAAAAAADTAADAEHVGLTAHSCVRPSPQRSYSSVAHWAPPPPAISKMVPPPIYLVLFYRRRPRRRYSSPDWLALRLEQRQSAMSMMLPMKYGPFYR